MHTISGKSPKTHLLARTAEMHAAILDAQLTIEGSRRETVRVGDYELIAPPFDETARLGADRALSGFPGGGSSNPRRGGGERWWRDRVDIVKFTSFPSLAAAYSATGDAECVRAARDYLEDFFAYFKEGEPWDNSDLRAAVRLLNWMNSIPCFLDSDIFDEDIVNRTLDSTREQLMFLLGKLKASQKPGNIRLFQANALFWASLLLRELPESADWLQMARRIYADTARREIEPDGSCIEHEPNYHGLYLDTFYNLAVWSLAFPQAHLGDYKQQALRVYDYGIASRKPSGQACGLQEGTSAWTGGSGLSAVIEKYQALQRLAGKSPQLPPLWKTCRDAGHVFMRDSWEQDAAYMVLDATRWGGGHSHLGRNGVILHAYGRTLLTNAGSLSYAMQQKANEGDELDSQMGFHGKSTRSKNTCTFNDWNQAETNPDLLVTHHSPRLHAVLSRYNGGYWPGPYGWYWPEGFGAGLHAFHERLLIWLPGGAAIVADTLNRWEEETHGGEKHQKPSLQLNWQFSPCRVELDADARRAVTLNDDANLLMLFPKLAEGMKLSLHEGELNPIRGWISTRGHGRPALEHAGVFDHPPLSDWRERTYAPAPVLRAEAEPMQEYITELVTVLLPYRGTKTPELRAEIRGAFDGRGIRTGNAAVLLHHGDGSTDEFVWSLSLKAPINGWDGLNTDAAVMHIHRGPGGEIIRGTALDAAWCEGPGAESIKLAL